MSGPALADNVRVPSDTGEYLGDIDQLASDLEFILVDKANIGSDILHRIHNMKQPEVYKWFAETSGLGLMEQAARRMQPKPAAR